MQMRPMATVVVLTAIISANLVAPAAAASSLNSIAVALLPNSGARVTAQFSGPPPKYTITGAGSSETSVIFQQATMGPSVPPTIAGVGPIRSVSVAQVGGNIAISLHLSGNGPVRVIPGGNFVVIDVPNLGPARTPAAALSDQLSPPPSAGPGQVTEVIPLKYADVSEVAGVLVQGANVPSNDNFNPQTSNFGAQSFGGAFNGQTQPFQQPQFQQNNFGGGFGANSQGLAQRVSDNLAIDRRLNAIILIGTPDVVASMREVVQKLDVPLDSVLLETQIVELDENAAKDLGVDFNGGTGFAGTFSYKTQSLNYAAGSGNFAANLYALEQKGEGRILAKPRILAQNGASASILTGDALPIITTVIVAGTSAVTSQQVNYVNVGVNLQILPRIAADGYITSHIFAEVSSVTAFTQGIPQISQRQAITQATVKDGDSFIIGGLLQDNEIRTIYKIPGIGDVPLIGGLFRRISSTKQKTNLYIVVTPHVIPRKAGPPALPSATPGP